ncbi:hypothetical protein GS068_003490 [Salmonella enterica]|nr:hypothetical protein [Salmonella enterica]ECU4133332.1 hypothetical protein [Salmonella enterica subsp. enterica serovar Thompson]EDT0849269.1 hypothetical protein [Salmonella enterica subsp. enterica serovar Berta]EDV8905573.1 hypothetical protein [Salmonella enterica subsp. enterica serovar Javiana]EDX5655422.1 hypothetical protein [Salmonella enterica subsp. enterica serovar Mississippi]EEE7872649.1 hypothetical protein [Salmonella enterica subsp. enterica serovar Enteritidis]
MIPVLFYAGKRSPYPYSTRWLDEFDNPIENIKAKMALYLKILPDITYP